MPRLRYKRALAAGKIRPRPGAGSTPGFDSEPARSLAWADEQRELRRRQVAELQASERELAETGFRQDVAKLAARWNTYTTAA